MHSTAVEIRKPLARRASRNARALTRCRRGELAEGSPLGARPGAAFLQALARFDRDLECYWHPILGRWILYRVTTRGAARSSDVLTKELVLEGPHGELREPGWWLIDRLRLWDKTRGGSIHHERATKLWVEQMERQDRAQYEAWDKKTDEISESFGRECEKYVMTERRSGAVPREYAGLRRSHGGRRRRKGGVH